ncbi:MBL fold metallo-hydrolase [Patescibacteria group bacterium]|nr:MBL fold metallo-hydrolase [Patescibacteria group bacterium]
MHINWYGHSCFKLQNSQQSLLINPLAPQEAGFKNPALKADIFIFTNPQEKIDEKKIEKNKGFLINMPGEYEVNGVFVYATGVNKAQKDKMIVCQVNMDNIKYGVLGSLNYLLSGQELEKLDGVDVLLIPIGGQEVINIDQAAELINSIEPKIIIPCCYDPSNSALQERFLKETGIKSQEKTLKFSLKNKDLSKSKESHVVFLEI